LRNFVDFDTVPLMQLAVYQLRNQQRTFAFSISVRVVLILSFCRTQYFKT